MDFKSIFMKKVLHFSSHFLTCIHPYTRYSASQMSSLSAPGNTKLREYYINTSAYTGPTSFCNGAVACSIRCNGVVWFGKVWCCALLCGVGKRLGKQET